MKQKEKNSIIIWFLLSMVIVIFSIIYSIIYIYPNMLEIEKNKAVLYEKIKAYNLIVDKGFKFWDFDKLNDQYSSSKKKEDKEITKLLDDWFYKKIYKSLDEDFYNKLIYNWSYDKFKNDKKFWDYLDEKYIALNDIIEEQKLNDKISKMKKVLPKYSELITFDTDEGLSDLAFINHVETILKMFNLKTKWAIWIKNLLAIENWIIDPDDNVYYIPLDLNITWTKESILNFITYINNTGDIEFSENDFSFSSATWSLSQLAEIVVFESQKYIDSSYKERKKTDASLKDFLDRTKQLDDIINVKMFIRFYVSGISFDKVLEEINSVIWTNNKKISFDEDWNYKINEKWEYEYELIHYNYNNLLGLVKKLNSNPILNKNAYYKKKINSIYLYLNSSKLKKDINDIKKNIKKAEHLESIYKNVLKYKEIFKKLDNEIYDTAKALWLNKDTKDDEWNIQKWIYPANYYF